MLPKTPAEAGCEFEVVRYCVLPCLVPLGCGGSVLFLPQQCGSVIGWHGVGSIGLRGGRIQYASH
jgi:hypothetical protein